MRTAGRLLMDTPNPDGRIFVSPIGNAQNTAITSAGLGLYSVPVNAAATVNLDYVFNSLILRYGMSDDALQQYGQGTPGASGFQGAQGQSTSASSPFTTPYGPTGRPPFLSSQLMQPVLNRPKGLMPIALRLVYSVIGAAAPSVT